MNPHIGIAVWRDNTVTVFAVERDYTPLDVFDILDEEADPLSARVFISLADCDERVHFTTNNKGRRLAVEDGGDWILMKWPKDILEQHFRKIADDNGIDPESCGL